MEKETKQVSDEDKYGPIPEDEFVVYGTAHAHPEHADKLEVLYREMTKIAQTEPGIIYYCLARSTADPTVFHFFERYESKKAFEKHTSGEGTQQVLSSGWVKKFKARFERPIKPDA